MRVVMLVTNPFKPDPRVYKEAKSLVNAGHEVIVLAWDREGKYPRKETVEGIRVVRFGPKSRYGSFFDFLVKLPIFYIKAFIFMAKKDFDAIHTHDFDTAFLGLLFKYIKGKKWVYDVHDLYHTFFEVEGKSTLFSRLLAEIVKRIDAFFAKCSDRLIVATQSIGGKHEGLREYYIREGIEAEKITTIWNVPILAQFSTQRIPPKKSREGFVIGFIGTIRTISNFIPLFEAVKTLNFPVKLLFVGGGKSLDELRKIVMERYRGLNVEFTGSVPYHMIQEYYRECSAIYSVYPYRENIRRAIAIKVFEATSLGVPVVVNSDTLMEDFVDEYRCGVATTLSLGDIKRALSSLGRIKFNPKHIVKKWNWERESEKLKRIYHQ
ncbi:glycosyltransferase family 4 protein [Thermococcus aggregans]|uniref:Glycosyltransferase family 4 protein n=1 Tax=Thermococcus aggregans TaxID=110163 RepID=A0A9E7MY08_THEAG|nr:glycosyltransferase family 4 protein [Thermococcus aggregans]USS41011.1 glycosyltransferase family 4 protein [Thermococcus aggregans]